jgi:hypothetical protein
VGPNNADIAIGQRLAIVGLPFPTDDEAASFLSETRPELGGRRLGGGDEVELLEGGFLFELGTADAPGGRLGFAGRSRRGRSAEISASVTPVITAEEVGFLG